MESLNLLDNERSPELPYDLGKAIEEAFVEHRPKGVRFEYLHPASAPGNRIARQAYRNDEASDNRRKASALALLSRIESWRLEYGRPVVVRLRNPFFGS